MARLHRFTPPPALSKGASLSMLLPGHLFPSTFPGEGGHHSAAVNGLVDAGSAPPRTWQDGCWDRAETFMAAPCFWVVSGQLSPL